MSHRDWSAQTPPLSGTIPASVGTLTGITVLYLNNNAITGTLPGALASLTELAYLRAGDNAISGTLPDALGSLTALTELALFDNAITGTLPDALGSLTALVYLCVATLRRCRRGEPPRRAVVISRSPPLLPAPSLPPPPCPCARLTRATLACSELQNNAITGTIPDALGSLTVLQQLCVAFAPPPPRSTSPRLAATCSRSPALLPAPFRRRSLPLRSTRYLFSNAISGTLPDALGSLTALQQLCVAFALPPPRRRRRNARRLTSALRAHAASPRRHFLTLAAAAVVVPTVTAYASLRSIGGANGVRLQPSARQLDHRIWSWHLLDCHHRGVVLRGQFRRGGVDGRRDMPGVHERLVVAVRAASSVHGVRHARADGSCVVHVAERKPERRAVVVTVVVTVSGANAGAVAGSECGTERVAYAVAITVAERRADLGAVVVTVVVTVSGANAGAVAGSECGTERVTYDGADAADRSAFPGSHGEWADVHAEHGTECGSECNADPSSDAGSYCRTVRGADEHTDSSSVTGSVYSADGRSYCRTERGAHSSSYSRTYCGSERCAVVCADPSSNAGPDCGANYGGSDPRTDGSTERSTNGSAVHLRAYCSADPSPDCSDHRANGSAVDVSSDGDSDPSSDSSTEHSAVPCRSKRGFPSRERIDRREQPVLGGCRWSCAAARGLPLRAAARRRRRLGVAEEREA